MKNQKGITLVALVVTIVVLLILAGITIALIMNPDNSIFGNARKAGDTTNSESVKELVSTALAAAETNYFARDTEVYKGVTDGNYVGTSAETAFAGDLQKEADRLGVSFMDTTGANKTNPDIKINDSDTAGDFQKITLSATTVKYGSKLFNVTIDTSADEPANRIKVGEGAVGK